MEAWAAEFQRVPAVAEGTACPLGGDRLGSVREIHLPGLERAGSKPYNTGVSEEVSPDIGVMPAVKAGVCFVSVDASKRGVGRLRFQIWKYDEVEGPMKLIDLHCDTPDRLMANPGENLMCNRGHVDVEKLKKAKGAAQVFAIWGDMATLNGPPFPYFLKVCDRFQGAMAQCEEHLEQARSFADYATIKGKEKIAAFLSLEDGGFLEGKKENLLEAWDRGVRMITLTWNYPNELGYPNHGYVHADKGLTRTGFEFLEIMEEKRILPDVSHLSDRGTWEVLKTFKGPVVASHSNARSVFDHWRNLTDGQLKALAETGGVAGLNFFGRFLDGGDESRVDPMVAHVRHVKKVAGIEAVAIGSDFDGMDSMRKFEIEDVSQMDKLAAGLEKGGFKSDEMEKIFYKNAERVFGAFL